MVSWADVSRAPAGAPGNGCRGTGGFALLYRRLSSCDPPGHGDRAGGGGKPGLFHGWIVEGWIGEAYEKWADGRPRLIRASPHVPMELSGDPEGRENIAGGGAQRNHRLPSQNRWCSGRSARRGSCSTFLAPLQGAGESMPGTGGSALLHHRLSFCDPSGSRGAGRRPGRMKLLYPGSSNEKWARSI